MAKQGTAVIGAGFIGPVHVEALRRAGQRVVGIMGVDEAESKRAAAALDIDRAYLTLDEIWADDNVRAVHIAVPNKLHYPMAKAALAAGKHVLCEKPLAMNSAESAELVALAAASGLVAGVNYNIRYYPVCLEAKAMARDGRLGRVYSVCGSYVQDWLFAETDYNWRLLASEGGELRAVADVGTHWLDLIHNITGLDVEAVCADLKIVHEVRQRPLGEVETYKAKVERQQATEPVTIDTEDYGAILLRFVGGARGVLWCSQVTAGRKNCLRFELAGSECALNWESERPNELWVGHRERANELLLRDPALVSDSARAHIAFPGGHNEGFPDTFKQCFRSFYQYLDAGDTTVEPTYPTFADGHREIVLCEAILASARQGGWVSLG